MQDHYWTYGAEHELADWDAGNTKLPPGYSRDVKDHTIVNSNGIANDPSLRLYGFGGEICTPPTSTIEEQASLINDIKVFAPLAKVNYRSNLHTHVRVPGLVENLALLKQLQSYIHKYMRDCFPLIEPISSPAKKGGSEHKGALRRYRRMLVSHHTLLSPKRLKFQLEANTVEDFFSREVPQSKEGKPLWHLQPRVCVNLRQLRETDTVEFRHWPGTLSEEELLSCLWWTREFMRHAIQDKPILSLLRKAQELVFPKFCSYDHSLEEKYRMTVHDGSLPKETIKVNIQNILSGRQPTKVLVVCHGNINRSPLCAELLARKGYCVTQAACKSIKGAWRDEPAAKRMRETAEGLSLDLSLHRSQRLTPAKVKEADYVIYMDGGNLKNLRSLMGEDLRKFVCLADYDSTPAKRIPDPAFIKKNDPAYKQVVDMIVRCSDNFSKSVPLFQ